MTKAACPFVAMVAITSSLSAAVAGSPSTAEIDSKRSDYHWRLPSGWLFVEPDRKAQGLPTADAAEVVVARAKDPDGPVAILVVSEMVAYDVELDRKTSDDSEQYGRTKLGQAGASNIIAERVSVSGIETTRVSGIAQKLTPPFRSIVALNMGRRRFEIVCSGHSPPNTKKDPCDPALAGLTLRPRDDAPVYSPRPLRLRGAIYGIYYDPPDDRWLGIGPRLGMGGAQKLWVWMLNNSQQIDVQGLDVSVFAAYPDAKGLANQYAAKIRSQGERATIGTEKHGGLTWVHIEVSRNGAGKQEDIFIHRLESMVYTIHVALKTRDPSLVRRALAGFILDKTTARAVQPGVAADGATPRR